MNSARKQRWQQATALVSLSTAGAMTGIAFAHGTLADMTSPTSMPTHLLAFNKPTTPEPDGDAALRSAIVNAATYYLKLAQGKTPAEMEALIWQGASTDGADHGESCAAFASLTLETGAQATGQQSWVTGGTTYPWPLHQWADVRVDPNPQSPGIISVLQDADAHQRWHPLGDGYTPQPGDWVMFTGHVEVVIKYAGGVLYTIGGDSMPNLSVNAHQYDDPLGAQGITGFVNNGELLSSSTPASASGAAPADAAPGDAGSAGAGQAGAGQAGTGQAGTGQAGTGQAGTGLADAVRADTGQAGTVQVTAQRGQAVILGPAPPPGNPVAGQLGAAGGSGSQSAQPADTVGVLGTAAIPAAPGATAGTSGGSASHRYSRSQAVSSAPQAPDTAAQRAFIQQVAPGAIAAQRQYGIPAAVTIAQAIDESGWGQSQLAAQDNNLFGIKGSGPAGTVMMPTQEYQNGQWVTVSAPFRVYHSVAESIADHSLLLATGSSYKQAMADRQNPDAFANDLTGVYATDPSYGANLISIMRLYNLYPYGSGTQPSSSSSSSAGLSGTARLGTGLGSGGQGTGAQGGAEQSPAGGGSVLGVVSYGPALGVTGEASPAQENQAFQAVSSVAASIPGVAEPGPAHGVRHGSAQHGTGRATGRRAAAQTSAAAGSARSAGRASGARQSTARATETGTTRTEPSRSSSRAGGARARSTAVPTVGPTLGPTLGPTVGWPGGGAGSAGSVSAGGVSAGGVSAGRGSAGRTATGPGSAALGGTRIPGVEQVYGGRGGQAGSDRPLRAGPRNARISTRKYVPQIPQAVTMAFVTSAKTPLLRSEPLYRDVARDTGVRWQLLAACDWMQCQAQPRVSPVYGEKLGTKNPDGTVYRTKSSALEQCARDLVDLARMVYGIDLTERLYLSIRDLASVFAAFRWGGLLAAHHISAMEFPYSVEGLTAHHLKMRWPDIPDTPRADKAGARFPMAFGAVPVVLGLDYRAVA